MAEWSLHHKILLRASELSEFASKWRPVKEDGTPKKTPTLFQRFLLVVSGASTLKIHSTRLVDDLEGLTAPPVDNERKAVHKQGIELAFQLEKLARSVTSDTDSRTKLAGELQDLSERLVEFAGIVAKLEDGA